MSADAPEIRLNEELDALTPLDHAIVRAQLHRNPQGAQSIAWRCPCGKPGVVQTAPRLPDGTPFPTTYYLTCPNATKAVSTLEGSGMMSDMQDRLGHDADLARRYETAHEAYLRDRDELGERLGVDVPEIAGRSAGGMPTRVKCLHALLAHALAAGPGVNTLGDEVLAALGEFWVRPCLEGFAFDSGEGQGVSGPESANESGGRVGESV
ncbi:MAG: DUF501 domain-containing protein [Propionibacteriaceae bacterium]|jgi:hypothetical protein|nr:DUF501 domain-containing protein [Propionibacteriaceae bacterium]